MLLSRTFPDGIANIPSKLQLYDSEQRMAVTQVARRIKIRADTALPVKLRVSSSVVTPLDWWYKYKTAGGLLPAPLKATYDAANNFHTGQKCLNKTCLTAQAYDKCSWSRTSKRFLYKLCRRHRPSKQRCRKKRDWTVSKHNNWNYRPK